MNSLPSLVTTGKSLQPFGSVFDFLGLVFVTWCFILTLLVNHSKYSEKSGKYLKSNQESTSDTLWRILWGAGMCVWNRMNKILLLLILLYSYWEIETCKFKMDWLISGWIVNFVKSTWIEKLPNRRDKIMNMCYWMDAIFLALYIDLF